MMIIDNRPCVRRARFSLHSFAHLHSPRMRELRASA